ncbi:hypothetical protein K1719_007999 [Acacia pycnantha]|nr:hypothetical protein K1719_007999 [Acacia pycnantha]
MSRKVSKSMKNNEKTDLQKQIGCITGLFQLFDRHRFISGGNNDQIRELGTTMPKAKAKNLKAGKEKQQFSTESSITSQSTSSCSSSKSSVDFSRAVQVEAPPIPHVKIPRIPTSEAAPKQPETPGHQSHDPRSNVKDSKHREAQGLTVKTVAKEGKKGGRTLKYIDSPRPEPFQTSKSVNAGALVAKEPLHILPKSQKAPWDSPRHSYDERVTQDSFKSTARHKELPRLSLDSRAGSIRSLNEGAKSRNLLKGPPQKGNGSCSTMVNQLQEPETSRRQSSVVAKLMGLDAFPDRTQTYETMETSSCPTSKKELLSRDDTSDELEHHQSYGSPRIFKGSTLLQYARTDSYLPFSQEPTRRRQPDDASQGSQFPDSKNTESAMKASNSSHSVYAEVEKRLAVLEFKKSGKDLRALKQILEAMQRCNHSLDITRDQASNCPSDNMSTSSLSESSKVQSPRYRQKDPKPISTDRSNSSQESKLPIVIMKPARVKRISASQDMSIHGKSGPTEFPPCNSSSRRLVARQKEKSITPKIRHLNDPSGQPPHSADKSDKIATSELMETPRVPRHIDGENTSSGNKTETVSPRLHKKFGWERRSLPTASCSSSDRRQHNRGSLELSSPSTTPRPKLSTVHEANERFSKTICPRKGFKDKFDAIPPDSYTDKRLVTHSNIRVIHTDQSEISRISSLPNDLNHNKAAKGLSNESSLSETTVITEQLSPISVLDAAFYRDDPPSPIKKKSDISKDSDAAQNADDEKEENSTDLTSTTEYNFSNWASDGDLNTQFLVPKLQKIDSPHDNAYDFVGPLSDSKDPDHKYIYEILFASGLLSGPGSSQTLQSSPHLNGTMLFLALEQIKTKKRLCNTEYSAKTKEQVQRKLVLDVVYDILVQKLILEGSPSQWFLRHKLVGRKLRGQELLCEICSEFDKLRHENKNASLTNEYENLTSLLWGDLTHQPAIRTNNQSEIPDIVLDIERLIFKDLITEVVRGEVTSHPGKHCRQLLFPK